MSRNVTPCVALALCLSLLPAAAQTSGYGPIDAVPPTDLPVAVDRAVADKSWEQDDLSLITTELSPATLMLCRDSSVRFFANLDAWGLGGPTRVAVPGADTVRLMARGDRLDGAMQAEAWLLAWFGGARGWDHFDTPWLLVLQHRPAAIALDGNGLELRFGGPCGYVASMPLYGYAKPPAPAQGQGLMAEQADTALGVSTATWYPGLPPQVLDRCRWWAQVLRAYPVDCRETFSVDRRNDSVTLRQEMTWLAVADDFGTKPRKLAPLSPSLGLAWLVGGFPMRCSGPITDARLFTPYGPYVGVEGADTVEVRLDVLRYVHEVEAQQEPDTDRDPIVAQALETIRQRTSRRYEGDTNRIIWDHGGAENYCWQIMADRWFAKALAYMDPATRERAKAQLHYYFANHVLKEEQYKLFRDHLLLVGPGIGTWGGYDDAGKFSSNLLETLWCYAHYTGDWALIRERWPLIRKLFVTPMEMRWKTFGRQSIAEMGDEAAPPLYLARMAYRMGDGDTYGYACYCFARELVHHYLKHKGAEYFRQRAPVDSMDPMAGPVYLTNLWGDTAGWRIDGPQYPKETGERQYNNRWVRFSSEDVARFHRDTCGPECRAELDGLLQVESPYKIGRDTAHIAPSVERLRSLLLNEPPEQLAKLVQGERDPGNDADTIAYYVSFLRTSREPRYDRLIPAGGAPTPLVVGIQRVCKPDWPVLAQAVMGSVKEGDATKPAWPVASWALWKPPAEAKGLPAGDRWPFGQVLPGDGTPPATFRVTDLSWVTQALSWGRK